MGPCSNLTQLSGDTNMPIHFKPALFFVPGHMASPILQLSQLPLQGPSVFSSSHLPFIHSSFSLLFTLSLLRYYFPVYFCPPCLPVSLTFPWKWGEGSLQPCSSVLVDFAINQGHVHSFGLGNCDCWNLICVHI